MNSCDCLNLQTNKFKATFEGSTWGESWMKQTFQSLHPPYFLQFLLLHHHHHLLLLSSFPFGILNTCSTFFHVRNWKSCLTSSALALYSPPGIQLCQLPQRACCDPGVRDLSSAQNLFRRSVIWVFPKLGGKREHPPKWMVYKGSKAYFLMDDLGGTIIFGNTHIFFLPPRNISQKIGWT